MIYSFFEKRIVVECAKPESLRLVVWPRPEACGCDERLKQLERAIIYGDAKNSTGSIFRI